MQTLRLATVATVAALALGACGGSSHMTMTSVSTAASASSAKAASPGAFNDADVVFAQSMIPHHEQAIEMADLALDPKAQAADKIKALATRIKAAQGPEVKQMTGLLTGWGKPVAMDMSGGHDMGSMSGMMSSGDMTALGKLKGAELDKKWAAMMIAHHTGAIDMAKTVKAGGSNEEVRKLADAVIAGQSVEITELRPLAG